MLSNRPQSPEAGGSQANPARMSEWVVLDITAMTKSTTREKVLKVLKAGGMTVCKVTDPYMNEARSGFVYSQYLFYSCSFICENFTIRNKNAISITVKRADYETKSPDYPGRFHCLPSYVTPGPGSWIIEEDYTAQPEVSDPL